MKTDLGSLLRTIEVQATVIGMQSDALAELAAQLMQHITAEEAERCAGLAMMRRAAQLKESLNGGDTDG